MPKGYLIDQVAPNGHFSLSDGENPEAPVLNCFGTLANLWVLKKAAVGPTPLLSTTALVDSAQAYLAASGDYPVIIADFAYSSIKSTAMDDSLINLNSNSQLEDGPDLSASPYAIKNFLNATVLDSFMIGSSSFVISPGFYFTNTGLPDEIEIDFGDGAGFRAVSMNQPIAPTYGEHTPNYDGKTAQMTVRIKRGGLWKSVTFSVSIVQCQGTTGVPTPAPAPWAGGNNFRNGNIGTEAFNIAPWVLGNAYTYFRPNPAPGEENLYKKPIIIVEGFETGNYDPNKAENYRMGNLGWCQLWGGDAPSNVLEDFPLDKMPQLLNDLHAQNYDIIMLDFKDSKRSLINNAKLVVELINKINQHKTPDAEPNVVLGASAGGVISRYALAWMEQNNQPHCTRLFVSFDSPHQGAYISLGAQYMLDFFANNTVKAFPEAQLILNNLNSLAAKELLIYNVKQSNIGFHNYNTDGWVELLVDAKSQEHLSFMNDLNTIGYPEQLKKVAIASGSKQQTDQGFSPGTELYRLILGNQFSQDGGLINADIYARYWDAGSPEDIFDGTVAVVVSALGFIPWAGKWDTDRNIYRNPGNLPSIDRVPGGGRELTEQIKNTVDNIDFDGQVSFNTHAVYHSTQCFVPTISALDLNTTDYFYD